MYLKSLDLMGFKSFAEAHIELPKGVTAVIGPNGTGKSNVVDAILWVLGEQSTKTLRSEKMEDVIFNGTEQRKPLGLAEVSLLLADVDQEKVSGAQDVSSLLNDYQEVMITRRLYRNGDSEYLINKTPCRLKDIRGLLLDTRAGVKGHTVIEQGRIDQILNSSPQERRELIEETAGIVRYKKQKAEALRKLDATQQNLLRVRDIVSEVRRQLNALERQARQARNYQQFQEEANGIEIQLLIREASRLMAAQAEVEAGLTELDGTEASHAAEQARLSSDLETIRLELTDGGEVLNRIRDELTQIEQKQAQALTAVEVERNRQDLYGKQQEQVTKDLRQVGLDRDLIQNRIIALQGQLTQQESEVHSAEGALSELEASTQQLTARRNELAQQVETVRREVLDHTVQVTNSESHLKQLESQIEEDVRHTNRLLEEQEQIGQQSSESDSRLKDVQARRVEAEEQLQQIQETRNQKIASQQQQETTLRGLTEQSSHRQEGLAALDSRLSALEDMIRQEMGYGRTGEEETTSLRGCDGVLESVAEWLVVPQGLERAVEALLGERGRGWLVEDPGKACDAVRFLKDRKLGRGSFIPITPRGGSDMVAWQQATPVDGQSGVLGWALDLVSSTEQTRKALTYLFQGVLIVDTMGDALRLWSQGMGEPSKELIFVTLAGEVLDAGGVMMGGELESSGGLLQRKLEVQQLQNDRVMLVQSVEEIRISRQRLEQESEAGRAELKGIEETLRETEMRVVALRKDEESLVQKQQELGVRRDRIREELEQRQQTRQQLENSYEQGKQRLVMLQEERGGKESRLDTCSKELITMEEEQARLQSRVTDSRLAVAALHSQRSHDQENLDRSLKEVASQGLRLTTLEQQASELVTATQSCIAERERHELQTKELGAQADAVRARFLAGQERQTEQQGRAHEVESGLETARKAIAACRESRMSLEVRRAELNTQRATVEQTLAGTYQLTLSDAMERQPAESENEGEPDTALSEEEVTQKLQEELNKLRGKLARIGPVNLAAIEEQQALQERFTFLTTQEEDLSTSIKSLKEIIQRINRTTKQMFLETFNELQEQFGHVFGRFFPGGKAELILTEVEAAVAGEDGEAPEEVVQDEPGVDIMVQPPGKRLKNITMLSGGEKTLTAMALIFASFLIRPTPFCILDEIDAPLDEENIGRFAEVVRELSSNAQFMVITHNKRTMAVADSLFGVTMEDPGVSKLLSIRLADLQPV